MAVKVKGAVLVSISFPLALKVLAVRIDIGATWDGVVPEIGVLIDRKFAKLIALLDVALPIITLLNLEFGLAAPEGIDNVGSRVVKKELPKKTLVPLPSITRAALLLKGCKVNVPEPPNPTEGNSLRSLVNVRFPVPLLIFKFPVGKSAAGA